MAIAVGSSSQKVSGGVQSASTITETCAAPTGGAVGDFLLAVVRGTSTTTPGTIATPSGWTLLASKTGGINTYAYYRIMASADLTASYSFTTTGGSGNKSVNIDMTRFTGVDTTTPIDVAAATVDTNYTGSSNTVTATVPSITTVTANAWQVIALTGDDGGNSNPIASGFTGITGNVATTDYPARRLVYRARPTAGATGSSAWTWTGSYTFALQAITFGLRPATTVSTNTAGAKLWTGTAEQPLTMAGVWTGSALVSATVTNT